MRRKIVRYFFWQKFCFLIQSASVVRLIILLIPFFASSFSSAQLPRTPEGNPDLNGVWQSLNEANWNLEAHIASQGPTETLGAIGAVPPGLGVVVGGIIPYLPNMLEQRELNHNQRRTEDTEAKCFMPGVPRANYLPHPFQILQADGDLMIIYQFAGAVRSIYMSDQIDAPVESWMGWSNGHWEGDTLVVEVTGLNANWLDRSGNFASEFVKVTERYTLIDSDHINYEAKIEDPSVFTNPWTIAMPLYRRIDPQVQLLDFKCVEFAEELMYGDLKKVTSKIKE
jgi:hypothetical protein